MNFANHTAESGCVLTLNFLMYLMKTQREKCSLLIDRSTDAALYLFNLYCCHGLFPLASENFIHAHSALTSNGIGITHLAKSLYGSLYKVVRVAAAF